VEQVLDSIAVRVDGPRAWDEHHLFALDVTDQDAIHLAELRNGVLSHRRVEEVPDGVAVFSLSRLTLIGLVAGQIEMPAALADGTVTVENDPEVLASLVGFLAPVDPDFAIVTP
jgi:alkyl sulfatase BDS1-like metallo-beta-lactamase superfamily hydrolase